MSFKSSVPKIDESSRPVKRISLSSQISKNPFLLRIFRSQFMNHLVLDHILSRLLVQKLQDLSTLVSHPCQLQLVNISTDLMMVWSNFIVEAFNIRWKFHSFISMRSIFSPHYRQKESGNLGLIIYWESPPAITYRNAYLFSVNNVRHIHTQWQSPAILHK